MERLTRPNINVDPGTDRFLHATIGGKEIDWKQNRDSTLNVLINGPTSNGFCKDIFRKMARDLYGRLKAYEDIAELCGGFDRLRELAEADKDGRVVVLPCKVGDTVWRIVRDGNSHITRDEVRSGAEINPTSSATYVNVRSAFHEKSPDIEICCSCAMQIKEWLKPRVEEGKS